MADKVSAEEAYYVVLRTVVAGKQTNWAVMAHMQQLRQIMGLPDDLHKQYMEQIQADPEVCALTGTQPPAPKRQKTAAGTAAAAPAAAPAGNRGKSKPRGGRSSEPGYSAPAVIPTYNVPHRIAPHEDPHGLVGMKVNIIQEDDSTIEGMVVNYDPSNNQHHVVVALNTPDQAGDDVPLADYPDAYENLGPHPEYVSPYPPPAAATAVSMPPPAARPRQPSYSGAAGGSSGPARSQKQRKPPAARAAGAGTGGPAAAGAGAAGGGGGIGKLGQPPFNQAALDARLPQADLPELQNMLAAISRKERAIMVELEQAGLLDEELSRSVMDREELVRQICAH